MRVLLVEDEKRMSDALAELLRQENYDVDACYDGENGFDAIISNIYDLIILDVMLPKKNGMEIAKQSKKEGITTPILMLTAKSDLEDKINGLDCGADDYLTKPFIVEELLAHIRALLRRSTNIIENCLHAGDLILNSRKMTLSSRTTKQEIRLSEKEYRIMECIIANAGQIVTREQLTLKVWGYENESEYNNVEVYISFTRKKLKFIGTKDEIKSVRGIGYELRTDYVS